MHGAPKWMKDGVQANPGGVAGAITPQQPEQRPQLSSDDGQFDTIHRFVYARQGMGVRQWRFQKAA